MKGSQFSRKSKQATAGWDPQLASGVNVRGGKYPGKRPGKYPDFHAGLQFCVYYSGHDSCHPG